MIVPADKFHLFINVHDGNSEKNTSKDRTEAKTHPCFTTLAMEKEAENEASNCTLLLMSSWKLEITLSNIVGHPIT